MTFATVDINHHANATCTIGGRVGEWLNPVDIVRFAFPVKQFEVCYLPYYPNFYLN